jgi:hypothetical protein
MCLAGVLAEGLLDCFNELEFAAHGYLFWVLVVSFGTAVIQRKTVPYCQLPFSFSFFKKTS